MIPAPGNAGFNSWMELKLPFDQLNVEALYWSVQAVDASFQGGPFAPEQTFLINPPGNQPPVITGISDLTIPEDATNTLTLYVKDAQPLLAAKIARYEYNYLAFLGNLC